jgi:AcrR family transcriptional regulator
MVHITSNPPRWAPERPESPPNLSDWASLAPYVAALEQEGKITRTFARLQESRQRTVVEAILEEAVERGPAAVNIKNIAGRAGVAVGSLYQYFPDREGLLDFAVELCVRYMVDFLAQSRGYLIELPLREALGVYLSVGVEWGRTELKLVRFLGRAAYQGDPALAERAVRPIGTAMRRLTSDMLVAAVGRGEIRADVDLEAAARLVNVLTVALADSQLLPYLNTYFQATDESVPAERIAAAYVDFVLSAIGPRPSVA